MCLARAKARTYHPKGVHGPAAAPIVWRMASQLVRGGGLPGWKHAWDGQPLAFLFPSLPSEPPVLPLHLPSSTGSRLVTRPCQHAFGLHTSAGGRPSADEGLASVMVCRSEEDVAAALRAWASHGAVPGAPEDAAACDPWAVWQAYQQSSAPTSEKREAPAADAALLLQVGQVVEGEVDGIKPYGVFLKLTGLPGSPVGLMHKSQISMERIRQGDLVQLFPIGSTLKVGLDGVVCARTARMRLSTPFLAGMAIYPGPLLDACKPWCLNLTSPRA